MTRFTNLHQALRLLRRLDGRSQAAVAKAARISAAMLSNYEKGTKRPTMTSLGKVLDALGVPLQRLEEALDVVNDRPARDGAEPPPAAPPPADGLPPPMTGGHLTADLEVGLHEISRGFERVLRLSQRRPMS